MTRTKGIGMGGMVIIAILASAMIAVGFFFGPERRLAGELGICLPSPNLWDIPALWSWGANTILLAVIAVWTYLLNRHFNFIRSTQPVVPAMFLILTASNPWITDYLSSSTLICLVNILCLTILFGCFRQRNTTQQMFVIGTFFSIGSMFQYAFLPYIIAYVAGAIVMKAFRIKEFLAMGMGLVAPYWVGVGLGIIPTDNFRLPEITDLFNGFAQARELFVLMASVGCAIFFGLILGLNNSIKLYAGNSRVNALNIAINLVGVVSTIFIIVDFSNMMAYMATLYFAVAVQVANLCALWHIRREWLVVAVPVAVYIGFFVANMLT